jgi:LPXTG-motif cell wall-anchored protein
VYAFVIYGAVRGSAPGGFLITDTRPRQLLRVGRETNQTSSGGTGTDLTWLIAVAAGVLAIGVAAAILRRRRAR